MALHRMHQLTGLDVATINIADPDRRRPGPCRGRGHHHGTDTSLMRDISLERAVALAQETTQSRSPT